MYTAINSNEVWYKQLRKYIDDEPSINPQQAFVIYGVHVNTRNKQIKRYANGQQNIIKHNINTLIFQIDLHALMYEKNKIWKQIEASQKNATSQLFRFYRYADNFISDTITINVDYFGDKKYIKQILSSEYDKNNNDKCKNVNLDELMEKISKTIQIKATISNSNFGTIRMKIQRILADLIDSEHVELFKRHTNMTKTSRNCKLDWYFPLSQLITHVWWSLVSYNTRDIASNIPLSTLS